MKMFTFINIVVASFFLMVVCFMNAISAVEVIKKDMATRCAGLYCGRISPEQECGACPRGFQPNDASLCVRCDGHLSLYDQLYLGFMALLSLVLHWFFIDFTTRRKKLVIVLHLSALIESVLAAVLTLVMSDPMGSLNIRSCSVHHLSDWYTLLYNPSINYTVTLHCTQEMVFPLYSMVMIYYSLCLVFLLLMRTLVSYKLVESRGTKSIYAALYFLPILIVVQAVFGGLLYYAFPYIILVVSVVTSAIHLATMKDQNIRNLIIDSFTNGRNATILVGHWILHAYGIISLTELKNPSFEMPLLALVPFPALFYVLTVRCSHPNQLESV